MKKMKKMKKNKDVIISVRIDEETYDKLIAFMELSKESRSETVRNAIENYVNINNYLYAISEIKGRLTPDDFKINLLNLYEEENHNA